eukprot:CAMPEP_0168192742 /NCGR_PEP_ID=MMETSP0139_2-20121125/18213_1 /TAXON_ID=44445 /ORGANISM="Pseudo-nitzschia australis, Strain 10249 10 AB" /LENGTH=257 /DNA_ID=CAMNT_0008116007 /DNA_START=100 /DNA_END=873 /DNA_ORIENTATION=-
MVRILMLPTVLSVAVTFCRHLSPIEAFVLVDRVGQISFQQRQLSFKRGSSSKRKSLLNNDNTREEMEDNVLLLPLFEAELAKLKGMVASRKSSNEGEPIDDAALSEELRDTQRIEELKETIENAKTAAEFGVRRVQAEFYDAFSTCDLQKMGNVWNNSDDVCCVHPGMESLQGYTAVMKSWTQIFMGSGGVQNDDDVDNAFHINPSRVKVDICGRTAICTCVELTNGGSLEALNIYRREGGTWKMVNHMASPTIMRL